MTRVTIDPRFCGPPNIGQGGYVSGLLAEALGGSDVRVTLRAPAPLGRALSLEVDGNRARLTDDGQVVAEALREALSLDIPPPPTLEHAEAASSRFDRAAHLYPGCFVCGPARDAGDGWRIFPGKFEDGRVAATWTPDHRPCARDLWAALDCPGYFAVQDQAGRALLASMQAKLFGDAPAAGQPLVIQGWSLRSEGRKHRAATALHAADGALLAATKQLWVTVG